MGILFMSIVLTLYAATGALIVQDVIVVATSNAEVVQQPRALFTTEQGVVEEEDVEVVCIDEGRMFEAAFKHFGGESCEIGCGNGERVRI